MSYSYENVSRASPKTDELFEALLQMALASSAQKITRRKTAGPAPLSFAQERLWFLDQLEPANPVYNILRAFRLAGPLDAALLEKSLKKIVKRHEALRTTFTTVGGQPVQVISPALTLSLPIRDFSNSPESERESQAQHFAIREGRRGFDLAQGPLLRATLLRLGEEEHVFVLVMHHIIADGWSIGVFLRELATLYEAFLMDKASPLPELPVQYADFAVWQREWLHGEILETQVAYWKQQLSGHLPALNLPTDHPRPAIQTFRGAHQSFVISKELTEALKVFSQGEGVTLFMTLLGAFKALLLRYTGQEDIFVGTPVANRKQVEIKELIGYLNNIVLMRTDLSGDPDFRELVGRVRQVALGAYQHQDLPFQELANFPNLVRTPLSQTMFALRDTSGQVLELSGISVDPLDLHKGTANFDWYLLMEERADKLGGTLEYKSDLFEPNTITHMLEGFQALLEGIVANPGQRLSELLRLLAGTERKRPPIKGENGPSDYLRGDGCPLPALDRTSPDEAGRSFVAPRNKLELELVKIWERVLGLRPISVRDNFFSLGGHSLLAVRLFVEMEKAFSKSLPMTALFQAPTIEQLADILRQEGGTAPSSSLVAIRPFGSKLPFFCLPGNMVNVFTGLAKLAQHFSPEHPFYGFQDGIHSPTRVEAAAARYLDEIRAVQPEGPYLLGGVCYGAVVAFEMARQLQAQGQQVALLAIVEPSPLRAPGLRPYFELVVPIFRRFIRRFGHHSRNIAQRDSAEQRAYFRLKAKAIANSLARIRYAPQPYPGPIHLFLTGESLRSPHNPQLGWRELGAGGVEVHEIPGSHNSVTGSNNTRVEEAHMQALAEQLKACIDDVLI